MKLTLLSLAALLTATLAFAAPRPITPAEEAAVRLAFRHLEHGPAVLWDATSAAARFRKLGAEQGRKEIELRVGPKAGAEWELVTIGRKQAESTAAFHVTFPSGIDDTIVFEMTREGTAWRIADIRSMSDPVRTVAAAPEKAAPVRKELPLGLMAAGIAAVLLGLGTFAVRPRFRIAGNVFACLTIAAFACFAALFYARHRAESATQVAAASLVGKNEKPSGDRDRLRNIQLLLQRNDLATATSELAKLRDAHETPLAQILAGRMAFLLKKDVDAVLAYERAMELGPERDDLLYEMATTLLTLGFRDRAERYLRQLDAMGSREADAYYSLAVLEAANDAEEKAERQLLTAFRARPELRARVLKARALHGVLRRPDVRKQFAMHAGEEPLIAPAQLSERPLTLPIGASARVLGNYLEIDLNGSKLQVPGGAFLAPAGASVLDAGMWDRSDAAKALISAPALAKVAAQSSTYAQPALTRRIVETASALATHHRWTQLIELTNGVTAASDLVPADLLLLKTEAHRRTGRTNEARTMLRDLLGRPAHLKRLDGRQLLDAGEMLAALGENALAIRILERAGQLLELPQLDDRIRQLSMNDRLATFSSHTTPHFVIRYSNEETGKAGAVNLGEIAEMELMRLQKWIPVRELKPVTINMLSWETFRGTYTGTDHILGFYDGQITVPFANVGHWPPEIVATLSHELAHAMIAQRTRDQAPRWFQEGFAQRIESVPMRRNPFNMYDPEGMLAVSLLDDVMAYSPDPATIGQGYLISHALIRYVEGRWGQGGLVKMLDAFASGATTEEAVETLSGRALPEFNRAFVEWGSASRDVFVNTELVSYER